MKKNIHPESRRVVFQDVTTGDQFLITSTAESAETVVWSDGQTYPVVKVEVSSASHPVYTGKAGLEKRSSRQELFVNKYKRETLN